MSEDEQNRAGDSQIDRVQLQYAVEQLRSQQNWVAAVAAGGAAAAVGAAAWAGITVATGYQIGFMAIGIGFIVGLAVRSAGKGIDKGFGVVGAGFAGVGCAVGNLLAVCGMVAQHEGVAVTEVLSQLDLEIARRLMVATFSPMDLVFYGIALYEGYRLSFRQLAPQELEGLLRGRPAPDRPI
jgi:hypothetical protein